ncbi:MAG: KH domain-containing protein [Anaerolineae bacterium]|nr:MAG: KH domain-containing protein [Anaerolineae bacterium]
MEERTTLEVIAPTVEQAIADGLAQLGLPADAVTVEVLDSGSKGFLGLGGRQVRIRLTVKAPSVETPPVSEAEAEEVVEQTEGEKEEDERVLHLAREVVTTLLKYMHVDARVFVSFGEASGNHPAPVRVDIRGQDLGVLIGRRSETINALQFIVGVIVSKEVGRKVLVLVDVEGYRERREQQLRRLARRMAEQAVKTGRRQILEPMPPNERRIIHLELRDHPHVRTVSIGEEPHRKVTIEPKESHP